MGFNSGFKGLKFCGMLISGKSAACHGNRF